MSQAVTLSEYLKQVKAVNLDAQMNQLIPFDYLVEKLNPARSTSYSPLFQIMFTLNLDESVDNRRAPMSLDGVEFEPLLNDEVRAKFELSLSITESSDGLQLSFEYNTDLFKETTIERLSDHLLRLLNGFVCGEQALEESVSDVPMLSQQQTDYLVNQLNNTQSDYPTDQCIHPLFEQHAASTPESVAVVCDGLSLSYRELNERSNRLAHYLVSRGVKPDVLVGLCVDRSLQMVVGILAILKAGGAYVPLDPTYPEARLSYMLNDSAIDLLLSQSHLVERLPFIPSGMVLLEDDQVWSSYSSENPSKNELGVRSSNLAYCIYTSGSSGQPKGVLVEHGNVVSLVCNVDYVPLSLSTVVLQLSSISFDAATFELWAGLLNGGRVVIQKDSLIDMTSLGDFIEENSINTAWMTSGLLDQFATSNNRPLSTMKYLLVGGDVVNRSSVEQMQEKNSALAVINGYGPTECTTFSCSYLINIGSGSVPIGKPLTNRRGFVLDESLRLVPLGVIGELHIGGAGVARGYLNQAELTKEKFIANPFSQEEGARLYKTGDLVRWMADGNLEFIGRNDDQVKVRGFRIELDEVRSSLLNVDGVRDAVVVARGEPSRLEAHVVPALTNELDDLSLINECRSSLKAALPDYMVPSLFMLLDAIPLTANGKVDRKALPAPDASVGQYEYVAPSTEVERMLCEVWQELLGVELVGLNDDFFELGGHSLLVIKMVTLIENALSNANNIRHRYRRFSISIVFQYPTISKLLDYLYGHNDIGNPIKINTISNGPKLFLFHEISGLISPSFALADAIGERLPVYGFEAVENIELSKDAIAIRSLANKYKEEMRRVQPEGPYNLAGWSLGGNIAYEVALQLSAEGLTVGFLGLIDSYKKHGFHAFDAELFRKGVLDLQKQILKSVELETLLSDLVITEQIPLINSQDKIRILNSYKQKSNIESELGSIGYAIELMNNYHALMISNLQYYEIEPIKMAVNLYVADNEDIDMSNSWVAFLETAPFIKKINSTHQTIIQPPNVDEIANDIVRILIEK
ncbi:MAG: amino acid adenylation domain-containing protein [Arenicella sp.]